MIWEIVMNNDFIDIKQVLSELKDKDKYIRASALDKLDNHPDAYNAIPLLKDVIKEDPIPFLRRLAIGMYPDFDPSNSYSVLVDALKSEKHETVIREIALVLFSIKSIDNVGIKKLLDKFKDYNVSKRYWILVFLANIESASNEIIRELLLVMKNDKSGKIRSRAALTLSHLNVKIAESDIYTESKKDGNKKYRLEYIYALIKLSNGDDKYISLFEKSMYEMKVGKIYLIEFNNLFLELKIKHKFKEIVERYLKFKEENKIKTEQKLWRKEKTQDGETKEISLAYMSVINTQEKIILGTLSDNVDLRGSFNQLSKAYNDLETNNISLRQALDIKDNFISNLLNKRNIVILILADMGSLSVSMLFNILTNRIGDLQFINIYLLIAICIVPPITIFVTIWIIQIYSMKKAKKNIM